MLRNARFKHQANEKHDQEHEYNANLQFQIHIWKNGSGACLLLSCLLNETVHALGNGRRDPGMHVLIAVITDQISHFDQFAVFA